MKQKTSRHSYDHFCLLLCVQDFADGFIMTLRVSGNVYSLNVAMECFLHVRLLQVFDGLRVALDGLVEWSGYAWLWLRKEKEKEKIDIQKSIVSLIFHIQVHIPNLSTHCNVLTTGKPLPKSRPFADTLFVGSSSPTDLPRCFPTDSVASFDTHPSLIQSRWCVVGCTGTVGRYRNYLTTCTAPSGCHR